MEDLDQEAQEIDPPILNRTRCKKYHRKILLEPLTHIFAFATKEKQ
jgi:hypothetical protein